MKLIAADANGQGVDQDMKAQNWFAQTVAILLLAFGLATDVDAQPQKPRAASIDFAISNKACFSGKGLNPYIQRAIGQRVAAARRGNIAELDAFYVPVASRPWNGLTVTAVGLHYESTSVYFREPIDRVRQVLRRGGVRIDDDGAIPMVSEEAVEVQSLRVTKGVARRYGASEVNCGV